MINLSIGGLGFLLSWLLFGLVIREPTSEPSDRGLFNCFAGSKRWFSPGRPWVNSLACKDFHFIAGGTPAVLIRFVIYPSLYLVAHLWVSVQYARFGMGGRGGNFLQNCTLTCLGLMLLVMAIDAGLVVSRSLHEEVREKNLAMLMLLPTSINRILYSKILGSLVVWLPGPVCYLVGTTALPYAPGIPRFGW